MCLIYAQKFKEKHGKITKWNQENYIETKEYQQKGRNYKKEPYKYSGAEKNNTWNKFTKGVKQ